MKVLINSASNIVLFRRMNQAVVDSYKRQGIVPNMAQHRATFELTHGVRLEFGRSQNFWKYMEFATEQDYLMAVLKWR